MKAPGFLWIMRALWLALPFTLLDAIIDATAGAPRSVAVTAQVLFWILWALGALLTLLALPSTLTGLRIVAPIAPTGSLCAAIVEPPALSGWIGLAASTLAAVLAMSAAIGDWYVDGSSYGDERRFALRPPAALLMIAVPIAWLLTVAPLLVGTLLFAAEAWAVGVPLLLVGIVTAWWGSFALWRLARRWLVFVPAGVTVVDEMALAEPVLFAARVISHVGPAHVGSEAADLTVGAPGLVLELDFSAPVEVLPTPRRCEPAETAEVGGILVVPSRPAAVLDHAESRGLSVSRS
ncbi:MAG: hypothetical protein ACR2OH_09605 [Microthrixaceae bacterium]